LLATAGELSALLDSHHRAVLGARSLSLAPVVIVKRGSNGATVHLLDSSGASITFDVATRPLPAADTTGAGDAFDAGFLVAFAEARRTDRPTPAGLRRAVLAGHRAAARQLSGPRAELDLR
ncbi:MAG: PfkB family carbohydrate kinase, partial [Candidatus Limnocylindrales bacterium]